MIAKGVFIWFVVSALLIAAGVALYPFGWDNREVRESCGNASHIYKLDGCVITTRKDGEMYFLFIVGQLLLIRGLVWNRVFIQ